MTFSTRIPIARCDFGDYNTAECGFDGGDCLEFNLRHPNCLVEYPWKVGDGRCNGDKYNAAECGFDGGDCDFFNSYPNCTVEDPAIAVIIILIRKGTKNSALTITKRKQKYTLS